MQRVRSPFLSRISCAIILLIILSSSCFCVETEDPIRNGGGARPLGIGRAATAVLDDINTVFYNPAGLVGLKSAQFMGMYYTKIYGNYHYFVCGGGTRLDWGEVGLGFISSGISQVPVTTTGTNLAYAEYADNLVFASYANSLWQINPSLQNVFVGTNLKMFSKGTTGSLDRNATGYNLDLGIKYVPAWWFALGLCKQNILGGEITWNTSEKEDYPSPVFIGCAIKNPRANETYSFDGEFPSSVLSPSLFHMGMEHIMSDYLVLRAGMEQAYDSGEEKVIWNPALGVGFILNGISIDYTFHPYYDDPGLTSHYVSLSFTGAYISDIRAMAGTPDKNSYFQEEEVPITVKVPFEASTVIAEAPNQQNIMLNYDLPSRSWIGTWRILKDFRPEAYIFNITVVDLLGKRETTVTNHFHVMKREEAPKQVETPKIAERDVVIMLLDKYLERKPDLNALAKRKEMAEIISKAKDYTLIATPELITKRFTDIDLNYPEAKYIEACFENKAIIGFTDDTYRPDLDSSNMVTISMMSDSEKSKEIRTRMWDYLEKIDRRKHSTFNDVIDAFIATEYLRPKYETVVPAGTEIIYQYQ